MKKTQKEFTTKASYRDLFERLLDATFLTDGDDLRILAANPSAERYLELSSDQLLEMSLFDFVAKDDQEDFKKFVRRAKRKYYPSRMTVNWKNPNGKTYVMEVMVCGLEVQEESETEVLQIMARDISYQCEIEKKLLELTITDELTQLHNIRHFKNTLADEHGRSKRYGRNYTIMLCDVDHFKNYNDTNGHPAGDQLLRELAKILKSLTRSTDMVARYGGEEFILLCREITAESVKVFAERILEAVRKHPFEHREKQPMGFVSMSIGLATFPDNGETAEDVIKRADEALYASKHGGRNRFTISTSNFALKTKKDTAA
jgi:diguanylate cyclase (GGDEF)-like protein/PAS domain S-box-containing protein